MRVAWIGLLAVACASKGADEASDGGSTDVIDTLSSDSDADTDADADADTDTDTDTPTFHYDSSDTGSTGERTVCEASDLPLLAAPPVSASDPLTGCMAGVVRTELVDLQTFGALPVAPLLPGSGVCVSDQLTVSVASDAMAEVPREVHLQVWDLTSGELTGTIPIRLDTPEDQNLLFDQLGICDPGLGTTMLSACDGDWFRPVGVSLTPGLATWTTGPAELEVSLGWGGGVDEVWFWLLVPSHELAVGPWPGSRDGDDWVGRFAWGDLGVTPGDEHIQLGAIGCSGGTPVQSRVFP